MSVVLKNIGDIVGFDSETDNTIYVRNGRICTEDDIQQGPPPRIVDCSRYALPGFVDLHGSLTAAADSEAAVRGGFTTVVQTVGWPHAPHDVASYLSTMQALDVAKCSVVVPGALTCGLKKLTEMGRTAASRAHR